jgi:hypothetical protein
LVISIDISSSIASADLTPIMGRADAGISLRPRLKERGRHQEKRKILGSEDMKREILMRRPRKGDYSSSTRARTRSLPESLVMIM